MTRRPSSRQEKRIKGPRLNVPTISKLEGQATVGGRWTPGLSSFDISVFVHSKWLNPPSLTLRLRSGFSYGGPSWGGETFIRSSFDTPTFVSPKGKGLNVPTVSKIDGLATVGGRWTAVHSSLTQPDSSTANFLRGGETVLLSSFDRAFIVSPKLNGRAQVMSRLSTSLRSHPRFDHDIMTGKRGRDRRAVVFRHCDIRLAKG